MPHDTESFNTYDENILLVGISGKGKKTPLIKVGISRGGRYGRCKVGGNCLAWRDAFDSTSLDMVLPYGKLRELALVVGLLPLTG